MIHRGQSGPDRADWEKTILGEITPKRNLKPIITGDIVSALELCVWFNVWLTKAEPF